MGLRCSLLGHDYGEPETTEEREERGDEEVVTVREFRQCGRCGAETVVSENTEVRRREPGRDEQDPGTAAEDATDADDADDRAADAIDEAEPSGHDGTGPAASADEAEPSGPAVDDAIDADSTDDDDAVILDGEADVRDTTQWPEDDPVGADDGPLGNGTGDGVAASGPAGTGAVDDGAPAADGVDAPEDGADAAESASNAGDWPDAGDDGEGSRSPPVDDAEPGADAGTGYVSAGSTGADDGARRESIDDAGITSTGPVGQAGESVDAVLVCPECGFSERAVASSLREGDICPEPDCGRGYLGEREP